MLEAGSIAVVGVASDENSSFLRGTAAAPEHIRKALHCPSSNLCAENGVDLSTAPGWQLVGDIGTPEMQPSFDQIEEAIQDLVEADVRVISLGGDHSITHPIVRAHSAHYPSLTILHLDAHPDLYDQLDGNRNSHACPFARIMEEGLADCLVSLGIRTTTPHLRDQADRFGVEIITASQDWRPVVASLQPPLYLSLDLDVLDPAFAPGISHHEPGGLSTREVLDILHALPHPPIGADIVELNPTRDLNGVTAMVAAKFLKEILAGMLG